MALARASPGVLLNELSLAKIGQDGKAPNATFRACFATTRAGGHIGRLPYPTVSAGEIEMPTIFRWQ